MAFFKEILLLFVCFPLRSWLGCQVEQRLSKSLQMLHRKFKTESTVRPGCARTLQHTQRCLPIHAYSCFTHSCQDRDPTKIRSTNREEKYSKVKGRILFSA